MVQKNRNSCGCCSGISSNIPVMIDNRPGLESLSYRIGNHSKFYNSLIAGITGSGQKILRNLTTREKNDFTLALFDAWSEVADILTFYQERIINESYIRTSTERRSVLELARLIGYELNPGVAASTYLAFTLEDTPGAFTLTQDQTAETIPPITLNSGIKVQSLPGPGEKAQMFETIETIEARQEWNAISPLLYQSQVVSSSSNLLYIRGITNNCAKGDILLIQKNGNILKKIVDVSIDTDNDLTRIKFTSDAELPKLVIPADIENGKVDDYKDINELSQSVIDDILSKEWHNNDLAVLLESKQWPESEILKSAEKKFSEPGGNSGKVQIFREQAFVFGHNAMKQIEYNSRKRYPLPQSQWSEWPLQEKAGNIYLDGANKEVLKGSFIALQNKDEKLEEASVHEVTAAHIKSRTEYGISAKTTHIQFNSEDNWWPLPEEGEKDDKLSQIRSTIVCCQSENLSLSKIPVPDYVSDDLIILNGLIMGLKKGQKIIVSGEITDPAGVIASEVMEIDQVKIVKGITHILLKKALTYQYLRSKCSIHGNVVLATHGETVEEILGSGKATQKFQQFILKHNPLTYVSSSTPSGSVSTLEIRVNDILWKEVSSFYGTGPLDHVYVTKTNDDGNTSVIFGDGKTGARLPGGTDNVKAKYRKGTGLPGVLKKNQISQLLTKPLGVKSAVNPIPSNGGADRENLMDAKRNAPRSILALDRVVSLKDYEDHARSFAGIAKTLASWSWVKGQKCVFLTVAGPKGIKIEKDSSLHNNLLKSFKNYGNPNISVFVESYRPKFFKIGATVTIKQEYITDKVLKEVEESLRNTFSFNNMEFGQTVTYGEIVTEILNTEGVLSVDLDHLYFSGQDASKNQVLSASTPVPGYGKTAAAELITIDAYPLNLKAL